MRRVVLHLLGSLLLAVVLLCVAEVAGRAEAHAFTPPTPTSTVVADCRAVAERARDLLPTPVPRRAEAAPALFGWNCLPPGLFPR